MTPTRLAWPVMLARVSGILPVRTTTGTARRQRLVEHTASPAYPTTFASYFGIFGVGFLVVLYAATGTR